jgi:signal transduction histidine kinase
MNKKTIISAPKETIKKLKVLAKKKENVRGKLAVTARSLRLKAKHLAKTAKEKESVRGRLVITARQLAAVAKEKESIKGKLEITAKKLAIVAKEKEIVRGKLAVTAERLRLKAKQLAVTAKEKESVRRKLEVTADALKLKAENLAIIAKEKESIKHKLATTAKEKESIRGKLAVTAKQLATTAKEKETVRRNLEVTAKQLAVKAKEIELANKELKSLDVAKDEFVSIASHQLRTPLTALKGYTGMLLDGDPGPINDKQREYLKEIKNANDRMIDLITALLNVSRVDLGVFVVEPEPVNFPKVAESLLKELEMKINDKKLHVNTNFDKDVPLINADLKIIRMILQNLLSNAVKYTPPEGNITLNIKKDNSNILISVTDTGYGIPKAVQSKIFTKMFRADNARQKDPTGTGLGLYIIKATIEQSGGKIWFESKENVGSIFYVAIPLEGMKKKEGSRRLE